MRADGDRDIELLSREELVAQLRTVVANHQAQRGEAAERERVLDELQARHRELEAQNRQLREAQSALADSHDRYAESEQRSLSRLEALDRAAAAVSAELAGRPRSSVHAVLQVIADQARLMTDAEFAALDIENGFDRGLVRWVFSGIHAEQLAAMEGFPTAVGFLGAAAREGRSIRTRDLREHPAFSGFHRHHPMVSSFLGVPIRSGETVLGNICLANKLGDEDFSDDDERSIVMLAERVGTAMVIARLGEVEARERARLGALAEAGRALSGSLDLRVTLRTALRVVIPTLADYGTVYLMKEGKLEAAGVAHRNPNMERQLADLQIGLEIHLESPHSILGEALRSRSPVLAAELERASSGPVHEDARARELAAQLAPTSCLTLPLLVGERIVGAMSLFFSESGRRYHRSDTLLAEQLAARCALAIENAQLFQRSQAAVRSRDELLAVVSHDLRNPIHAIRLNADSLARTDGTERRRATQKQADRIRRCVEQMSGLIDDLLTATTIEAGRFTVNCEPTDAADLVTQVLQLMEPLAVAKKVRLESRLCAELPRLSCDGRRILQVLTNLVGNALKFTRRGHIRIEVTVARGELCFAVADTGAGIHARTIPHLFERYSKGGSSGAHGVGLGLYIAKGIVDGHGGRIWVESRVDQGSTFRFTLPV